MGELNWATFVTGTVFFMGVFYILWKKLPVVVKFRSIGIRSTVCEVKFSSNAKETFVPLSLSEQSVR